MSLVRPTRHVARLTNVATMNHRHLSPVAQHAALRLPLRSIASPCDAGFLQLTQLATASRFRRVEFSARRHKTRSASRATDDSANGMRHAARSLLCYRLLLTQLRIVALTRYSRRRSAQLALLQSNFWLLLLAMHTMLPGSDQKRKTNHGLLKKIRLFSSATLSS